MKKAITILAIIAIIAAGIIPAYDTEAACAATDRVKEAAMAAMNEAGADVCFVIEAGKDGRGTGYMMYKSGKRAKCDRTGAVIIGRNEHIKKCYHYSFYRNLDNEKKVTTWKQDGTTYRWRYTSRIECAEEPGLTVHSYTEYKHGGTWKTCKGVSKNRDGVSMCKEFARYLWSMADPDCPVIFLEREAKA